MPEAADAAFYFDLASPWAYLAAERVLSVLGRPAEWIPVLARELPAGETFEGFRCAREADIFRAEVTRRAHDLGLQPVRWPEPFPFDSESAMRVATYARGIGRAVPFAQAAFRQAYAGGHSLHEIDFVLIAAAACEMHPRAVLQAAQRESIAQELREQTEQAAWAGVSDVPAVRLGGQVLIGERAPERAAAHVAAAEGHAFEP